ncbi:MAG TPA: MiaB/RimO family radical SAM methylthiotransferase [Gemmatimonadaceae bacterium]|nr:MiaB/RimO family radical SAM methylthiotransferase [Gemmatimonadaceae bacterium]
MRVFIQTFGCRANHYDSEMARAMLERSGHVIVGDAAEADVALFNSCAVTREAEADLRAAVRRASRAQPHIRSVIMGCAAGLAAERGDASLAALPSVEEIVPGADAQALARALDLPNDSVIARAASQTSARALLRVQDGCDEHCTFCATTLARGANRSRSVDALVDEARQLATHHEEIVITGIHIGSYGADIGSSLSALVERLVRDVPRVRFRLSSLEATEIDERLFALLVGDPGRVAPHLHAPLQSGSNAVLKRMGRHWYTAESYAQVVERIASARRVFGLGADIIVGFPGETDLDHERTVALVEWLPFTYLHVFPFSARPGTAAERLGPSVPPAVARGRARELRELGTRKAAAYRASRAGSTAEVIVVRGGAVDEREGVTEDYLSVLPGAASLPRGTRYLARLRSVESRLIAEPV